MVVVVGWAMNGGVKSMFSCVTVLTIGSLHSRESFSYLIKHAFKCLDFYLLWLTRFLFLAVGCGVLAHWKTFTFTHSEDDKLVSLAGGI